jgi:uncharacterized protein YndB with AHSA1/START domain
MQDAPKDIVVTRLLDAPRERVFDAWTDVSRASQWWGPRGFTTTTHSFDLRAGGAWRYTMHAGDGTDYPNRALYREIVRPERIAYRHDDDGATGQGFDVEITFDDRGGKTLVTLRTVCASAFERERLVRDHGAIEGAKQTLDRFAAILA